MAVGATADDGGAGGLVLAGVSVRLGRRQVLAGVGFTVAAGRLCALCGGNGAGKTTLCRIVAGYLDADAGAVRVGGIDRAAAPRAAAAQVAYLPEHAPLPAELTVAEYLTHRANLRGVARRDRADAIERALAQVAITDRRGDVIARLSKGLRQRVALAAAVLGDPPVLVLDEPAAGLDELQRVELRRLLRELSGHRTVLWSTHELGDVDAAADQVVVLAAGRVVADGDLAAVKAAAGLDPSAPLRDAVVALGAGPGSPP